MSITPFMNLELPTPSVTLGPDWAEELNNALELVDQHDHSSGKGVTVKTSGLSINADLNFNGFRAATLLSTKYTSQLATLTGAANASSVYVASGNLYYTNSSGVAVQITDGSSVVSVPASVDNYQFNSFNTDLTIAPSDNFVFISMDTSADRAVTLPLAGSVSSGRFYLIKDASISAETHNITVSASGSDLIDDAASYVINSNGAMFAFISDGVSSWEIS